MGKKPTCWCHLAAAVAIILLVWLVDALWAQIVITILALVMAFLNKGEACFCHKPKEKPAAPGGQQPPAPPQEPPAPTV